MAKTIYDYKREINKLQDSISSQIEELEAKIEKLEKSCKHPFQIITADNFNGDYKQDYCNWHPERRLCIKCGLTEQSRNQSDFAVLTKPQVRLPLSTWEEIGLPLWDYDITSMPYEKVKKICLKHGYSVR